DATAARSLLAKFALGADHVGRLVANLSPGERSRAELAALMGTGVNCLVLDEPTNHLDLAAIEQLEQSLDGFAGTLLVVSHDRRFLDALRSDRVIELVDEDAGSTARGGSTRPWCGRAGACPATRRREWRPRPRRRPVGPT